jgi:hypothetical protein
MMGPLPRGWGPVPEGFTVEWREEAASRIATDEERAERKCRWPGCQRPAAWALMRRNGWWLYCDWHTYGRRIDVDQVLARRLVRDEADE